MRPTTACGANEALAEMRLAVRAGEPYRLLLLDVMMPGKDGLSLAAEIQESPDLAGAPIVILSSADWPGDRVVLFALGVAAYLTKPVAQSELMRALQESLGTTLVDAKGRKLVENPFEINSDRAGSAVVGLRILLAEDNLVNQRVARCTLEKEGHRSACRSHGREAVAELARNDFDLVLMDLQMPEMDGMAATAAIRAEEIATGRHMPILALTAHAMIGDRERCLAGGMDGYVCKPISAKQLREAIADVWTRQGAARIQQDVLLNNHHSGSKHRCSNSTLGQFGFDGTHWRQRGNPQRFIGASPTLLPATSSRASGGYRTQ